MTSDIAGLEVGQARYGLLCNEGGTIVDDVIVYRTAADHVLMVVNAANVEKDEAHVRSHLRRTWLHRPLGGNGPHRDPGPSGADILAKVAGGSVAALQPFGVKMTRAAGAEATIARTGYTGEDGFEVFCDNADAVQVWQALQVAGRGDGIVPVGLGARDTLRLEARFSLYGNDIDETTGPIEAGLGWTCKLDKTSSDRVPCETEGDGPKRRSRSASSSKAASRVRPDVTSEGKSWER